MTFSADKWNHSGATWGIPFAEIYSPSGLHIFARLKCGILHHNLIVVNEWPDFYFCDFELSKEHPTLLVLCNDFCTVIFSLSPALLPCLLELITQKYSWGENKSGMAEKLRKVSIRYLSFRIFPGF